MVAIFLAYKFKANPFPVSSPNSFTFLLTSSLPSSRVSPSLSLQLAELLQYSSLILFSANSQSRIEIMEGGGKKPIGSSSSSSSIANELFGSSDSSPSSGVFGSIFSSPSKITGRDFHAPDGAGKKKQEPNDNSSKGREGEGQSYRNKVLDSIFEGERGRVQHPCNYSSSIYYGGQDMYCTPPSSQTSTSVGSHKKGVEEDDPHTASRGDWWQGSFYY